MFKSTFFFTLVFAVLAGCSSSVSTVANQTASQSASQSDDTKLICEFTRSTGSMLKNKRCRTLAQIEAEREEARNAMNTLHSSAAVSSGIESKK